MRDMTSLEQNPDSVRLEAQYVHTEAYLREHLISSDELNENGLYIDEYTERSEPILVKLGAKETTVRLIHTDSKKGGILSLPTLRHFAVDPVAIRDTAHAVRLSEIDPRKVVEISGLGSMKENGETSTTEIFGATRQAYAMALRRSLDQGHLLWVMNVEPRLKNNLEMILGDHLIKELGEAREYMGPATIPIALNPQDVVASILSDETSRFKDMNREDISVALQGVSEKHLTHKLIKALNDHDIATEKVSPLVRLWQNKRFALYSTMVAYSAIRFIPLPFVEEFDGSVAAFAAIDIGTAATQAAGMEVFFKSKQRINRALGATAAIASFMAPYAYVGANNGEGSPLDYPWYVYAVAGTFAGIGVGLETKRSITDGRLKHALVQSDLSEANN